MAGALTDPVDGAIFIFRNVTKEVGPGACGGSSQRPRSVSQRLGGTPELSLSEAVPCSRGAPACLQDIEQYVQADPYVINGLVPKW